MHNIKPVSNSKRLSILHINYYTIIEIDDVPSV